MARWHSSKFPGVRFREHPDRKAGRDPDRYYNYRYQVDNYKVNEGVGWASEGWTEEKVATLRLKYKEAAVRGDGSPRSLQEDRLQNDKKIVASLEAEQQRMAVTRTVRQWGALFLEELEEGKQKNDTKGRLERIYTILGDRPIRSLTPEDVNRFIKKAKKFTTRNGSKIIALRTVEYLVTQLGQLCRFAGIESPPTTKANKIEYDNKAERYLTPSEAEKLLTFLCERSQRTFEQALISLNCGLRADEIFSLKKMHCDFAIGTLQVFDSKNKSRNRTLYMTAHVKKILQRNCQKKKPNDYVFTKNNGAKQLQVNAVYYRVAGELFNEGVTDKRLRVDFHTLRHTYASWLMISGKTTIYELKKLLGHADIKTTERYAKLAPETFVKSAAVIEAIDVS